MKKVLLALALSLGLIATASAIDVGVYGGRLFATSNQDLNLVGVSAGQKFDKFGIQGTFDRSTTQVTTLNRYTVSGSYDVFKFGSIQTNVRAGVAYLDPQVSPTHSGGAGFVGAGVSYPVTQKVSLTADYAYQKGNNITKVYDGSIATAGVKYSF
jgi:outer membrane autotransporter protein